MDYQIECEHKWGLNEKDEYICLKCGYQPVWTQEEIDEGKKRAEELMEKINWE